ncbi:MAG: lipoyl synthase [archaeon]
MKPEWLRVRMPTSRYMELKQVVLTKKLSTVCQEAHCPNISECWSGGTATFMIMGDTCTRGCRFCNVKTGMPRPINPDEPQLLVDAIKEIGMLKYVVITSVDRDDLPDQGAGHFAGCIDAVKEIDGIKVEVLIPDFQGKKELLRIIMNAGPYVLAHNIETVERLQKKVRDARANYSQSLSVLRNAKEINPTILTKTSIMLGLGETDEEIIQTMNDLRNIDVDIITFGQYLRPSMKHLPVTEYVHPQKFKYFEEKAISKGFRYCASGPFVRSSYRAGELVRSLS